MITFVINRWNIFLYYSLAVLMALHIHSYSYHLYELNNFSDLGVADTLGSLIIVLIKYGIVAVLLLRLILFIYGAFRQKEIRRNMLRRQTFISIFIFLVCGVIFSKTYYHFNDPYKDLDGMRGQRLERVITAHRGFRN
ncbi:hypothetical protein Lepto7376_3067 [[Leptolyngbya] sp. PCC 7376]|nr:hypothetical protein Lepto7376_3067 [[Leptolyngbya] sp. PCC 7376]